MASPEHRRNDVPGFAAPTGRCTAAPHRGHPSTACGRAFAELGGGSPRRYCSARCAATRARVAAHRRRG
ncbi:CGNR zinc finger domain-containing protein [Prauserella halophila]|nr:CGNR zinc finger domain-containing protein [Prauserella halophila]